MRILIQNTKSLLFIGEQGSWSKEATEAHGFSSTVKAIGYIRSSQLKNVRVVLKFAKDSLDVYITVPPDTDHYEVRIAGTKNVGQPEPKP